MNVMNLFTHVSTSVPTHTVPLSVLAILATLWPAMDSAAMVFLSALASYSVDHDSSSRY